MSTLIEQQLDIDEKIADPIPPNAPSSCATTSEPSISISANIATTLPSFAGAIELVRQAGTALPKNWKKFSAPFPQTKFQLRE